MRASSSTLSLGSDNEAFVCIGQFSTLNDFSLDNTLHSLNSFSDDGAFVSLTFTPSLHFSGQTLTGNLSLVNGEELSGNGRVEGQISGSAGTSITASTGSLILGDLSSKNGFDFSGDINTSSHVISQEDADNAIIRGNFTLAGGRLTANRNITLTSGAVLSGFGVVDSILSGVV